MQVVAALVHKVGPAGLLGLWQAGGGHFVAHRVDAGVLLAVVVQRRHHAGGQHVVDELKEAFVGDMCVGEQEHHLLVFAPQLIVQCLHNHGTCRGSSTRQVFHHIKPLHGVHDPCHTRPC